LRSKKRLARRTGSFATTLSNSVRVTLGYRALGLLGAEEIVWFWIGTHAEYDRLLDNL